MTEEFDQVEAAAPGPLPVDSARSSRAGGPALLHTELDNNARMVTTILGSLTGAGAGDVADYLRTLPLLPDVIDCRYVHRADGEAIAGLLATISSSPAIVRPSTAMRDIVAEDPRYDLSGIDVPALHRCATAVAIHDSGLRYVYVNRRLAMLNGVSAERHRNRTCAELLRPTHDTVTPLLQRCLDDCTPMHCVLGTPAERRACRYLPACHEVDGHPRHFVVALISPPWTAATGR